MCTQHSLAVCPYSEDSEHVQADSAHGGSQNPPAPPPPIVVEGELDPWSPEGRGRERGSDQWAQPCVIYTPTASSSSAPPAPTLPSCTLSSVSAPLADAHAVQASALTCNAVHGNRGERTGRWL